MINQEKKQLKYLLQTPWLIRWLIRKKIKYLLQTPWLVNFGTSTGAEIFGFQLQCSSTVPCCWSIVSGCIIHLSPWRRGRVSGEAVWGGPAHWGGSLALSDVVLGMRKSSTVIFINSHLYSELSLLWARLCDLMYLIDVYYFYSP